MLVPARCDRPDGPSCSLFYIASRYGRSDRGEAWIINLVRLLIANEGFPGPLPGYSISAKKRLDGVTPSSRWIREAVDAWFDGFLPPQLVTVIDERRRAEDAARLDARAGELANA